MVGINFGNVAIDGAITAHNFLTVLCEYDWLIVKKSEILLIHYLHPHQE